ncbi:UDP-N-acetylmuramoyl-tripeptide--D-alanyl-D-alanine ligase [Litorivivens sp.]|uniref:UDP-N-acetylmuramoyl-tripeptide--D-alanyl-D- alanine ligase n=1 Tax=Litorivivens sp. TaxID=2020868 RepID=UPI00356549EE
MMAPLPLQEIAHAIGADGVFDGTVENVSTDSRNIAAGDLFVALRGENFDGHQFVNAVAQQGAVAAVVESPSDIDLPQLCVKDSLVALAEIAALNRQRFVRAGGRVAALTGSCGKTSCKEILATILRQKVSVLATRGNLNNEIGVPKTLLEIAPEHQLAVIEMGAAKPGDIHYLCQYAQPEVALITLAAPAHLEGFGSIEAVAKTKGEIYTALPPHGTAVINADDRFAQQWQDSTSAGRVVTVSLCSTTADVYASAIRTAAKGCEFVLHAHGEQADVHMPLLGEAMVMNALLASAAAMSLGATMADIAAGLAGLSPVPGRLYPSVQPWGLLIDDSYNANPASVKAAIDVLSQCQGRKILVLGDMAELGADSDALHDEVGRYAVESGIDLLFTCGEHAKHATEAVVPHGLHFPDRAALAAALINIIESGDAVLVKGSRSSGMDDVVKTVANSQVAGGITTC